jgi:hypothetical protein
MLACEFSGNQRPSATGPTQCSCGFAAICRADYVLIAIVKKELQLDASLYTCLQILSVSVFEETQLSCALQPNDSQTKPAHLANQLILFNF